MPFKHVFPRKGMITNNPPTEIDRSASPLISGCIVKDGVIRSDFGMSAFPTVTALKTNALLGSVMMQEQFYTLGGLSFLLALTTRHLYQYNTSKTTWDVITQGTEIDDCEAAWDASANVTSTADTSVKLRDSKSAKHVIAVDFTTGIVSSEDDVQNADISAATNTHLSFWVYSDTAVANDVLRLRLSEQATGGTGATYADYTIPAITADTWQHVSVAIASPVADNGGTYPDDLNALASVALVAQSDPGTITVYLDDIRTSKEFIGDEDNRWSITTYSDEFILSNGLDAPTKVTEAGGVLTHGTISLSLNTGAITTSEVVIAFKDHVLFMNNTENAADVPQRVSWSNIGDATDHVAGTSGFQDLVDDESWIIAAALLSENELIIYKERSIVQCTWVGGQTPFRFKTMIGGLGAASKEGVIEIDIGHAVLGPATAYIYKGGFEIELIDTDIKESLFSSLDGTNIGRSFILYLEEDNEIQFWIPTVASTPDVGWCYNTVKKDWYKKVRDITGFGYYQEQTSLTIGDLVGTIGEQTFRFGDALTKAASPITLVGDSNGKVYKLDKLTFNNAGVAIANEYQTPDFVLPDTAEYMNKFMRVGGLIYEASGQSITTTWSSDGGLTWNPTMGNATNVQTLTSSMLDYQQDFEANVKKIRYKFYNNTVSSSFNLRYYGFPWILRSGRK